jgi:ATP-binding cassette, subfamily B, bacterial MsbA
MPTPLKAGPIIARLWRDFILRHKLRAAALVPVLLLVAAAGAAYGLIMKAATDGLDNGDLSVTVWAPLAVIAATGVRAIAIFAQAIMSQDLGQRVLADVQSAMFTKLTRADYARVQAEASGGLVSRFTNDVNIVNDGIVRGFQAVARDAVTVIAQLAIIIFFDWVLALLVIGLFALGGPPLARIAKRARAQTRQQQETMGELTAMLGESLSTSRLVRTYSLETREIARADALFDARRKILMKLTRNRALSDPLLEVLGGLALAAVIFVAGARILSGAMTIGDLLGTIVAIATAAPAARSLGTFNTVMNEGVAALGRLFTLLDEQDATTEKPNAKPLQVSRGEVRFEGVGFAFGPDAALSEISFTAAPGQTVALVGPSGAGKSTLLNLLARLYDVQAGAIFIDGQDIRDVTLHSLRGAMALVAQDAAVFDDTIAANIGFGRPGAAAGDIERAARAAVAHDFITARPLGYSAQVGERGGALSGGERQRIALARAFLKDAPILLLDEATSALDAQSEAAVQGSLAELAKGRTTLVVAHRLATVRDADLIIVMDKGRIVEQGRHEDLLINGGLYAALARLQSQA